ncbi:hypothetical protein AAVH_16660 [Aphelenchoides avenae]|nr:hypothetical protein AAVH_16660 [Aphelenchus avenae]
MALSLILLALVAQALTVDAEQCTPGVPVTASCTCGLNECDVGYICDPNTNHGSCTIAQPGGGVPPPQCIPGVPAAVWCNCGFNACDVGYVCDPTKYHGTCTLAGK